MPTVSLDDRSRDVCACVRVCECVGWVCQSVSLDTPLPRIVFGAPKIEISTISSFYTMSTTLTTTTMTTTHIYTRTLTHIHSHTTQEKGER